MIVNKNKDEIKLKKSQGSTSHKHINIYKKNF